jgi:basic amino acid/polyamine antiporter, APA family
MLKPAPESTHGLIRGIGLWQATALNITLIVGAGVFATIPTMIGLLPGPYALLAWVAAGLLIVMDGMVWGELGAAMPRSGGSYHFLLECYGRERWGRLMGFLFIWQFMVSGPLELGSGLAAIAMFAPDLSPSFAAFDKAHSITCAVWSDQQLSIIVGPARLFAFALGVAAIVLLYRRVTTLGRITLVVWLGLLAAVGWILIEGALRFQPNVAFDFSGSAAEPPSELGSKLGPAMMLAIYCYLGYYHICYVGDEVREPARVIPRAIFWSVGATILLFIGLHLAMLGVISWREIPAKPDGFNLPAEFMRRIYGDGGATLISALLIGSCFGSIFAGLLGYSRIPFGAAREGHFFQAFDRLHRRDRFPHRSLLLVGGLTLVWAFFDLQVVIDALITTRLLEMFCGQIIGLMLLRRNRPDISRPWKMMLYPLPCLLALGGWLYVYVSSKQLYILFGAVTLVSGVVAFLVWSWRRGTWPFRRGTMNEDAGC